MGQQSTVRVRSPSPQLSFFSKSSNFQLGNKDLKPRTGSWRVYQILATINLAVWIGIIILFWLGLSSWNNLSIVFLVFSLAVIQFAYLNLYHLPAPEKEFHTTVTIPK